MAVDQKIIDTLAKQILATSDSSKWQGNGKGSPQANAQDMAKILANAGITDIKQFGVRQEVKPAMYYESGETPEQTVNVYYNKETGQELENTYGERQIGSFFGGTYSGKGNTGYGVVFDAQGNPQFFTSGASSSDLTKDTLLALGVMGGIGLLTSGVGAVGTEGLLSGASTTGAGATELGSVAGMGAGTGLTAGGSGLGLSSTGGLGLTAAEGLAGTGVLSGSTLGTGLLGGSGTLAGLTGTGILAGSELGTGLLGTTGTQALTGTGVLSGSTLGTELLGTGAGTAATTGGVTGLTNTANLGTGALTTGVDSGLLSSYVTPQAMATKIGANLPQGWESFTPQEKISWFNANNVTAEQLLTAGVPQSEVAFMIENGLGGTVAGMGAGTGITAGAGGLGLNAGTAGLGAEGLGAGITAGTGLTGTGVLTGSTLGTGLLGTTGTGALTGTGVLAGSTLGTGLLGTGAGTAVTTGGVTGLTGTTNLGTGALNTGVTGVTGVTGGTGGTTGGTGGTTGGIGGTGLLSGLISGGLSTVGGLLQQQTSREAAQAAQARIDAETAAAKQASQFRPIGMTTRFGSSQFTYNPTTGQLESAGYTLSPEAKAQQDRLMALSNQGLTQAEQAQAQFAPLQTGAQSLFNLGNKYLAQTPEEVAQRYINQQMALLQPGRELELANLQNKLMQQGRSGLAVAQGGSYGATTPELQALFNARAAQEAKLAADAELAGQQQVTFGAGLLSKGAGALGDYYSGQEKAYAPYTMASTKAQGLETLAERPLSLSTQIGQMSTNAGVNAANFGLKGAELSTKLATSEEATTNPYATILAGLGDPNSTISQGIANYIKKNWG